MNSIIAAGRADLCAVARPHLANPAWTLLEAAKIGYTEVDWPKQYRAAKPSSSATSSASGRWRRRARRHRGRIERAATRSAYEATIRRTPCSRRPTNIGLEARAGSDDHATLKLWLRMLACITQIETEIRAATARSASASRWRASTTWRSCYRHADGLKHDATLSRYLMVTGGNVTALTDELEREGLVRARKSSPATAARGSCA